MKQILIDFGVPFRLTKTGLYNYSIALKKHIPKYQDKFKILFLNDVYLFSRIYGFIGKLLYNIWLNFFLPFYLKKYKIELIHFTNYLMPFIPLPIKIIVYYMRSNIEKKYIYRNRFFKRRFFYVW